MYDVQRSKIQATIKRKQIPKFELLIEEGSAYIMENLLVAWNEPKYKTTNHKFKLFFMGSTKCSKFEAGNIPTNFFDWVSFFNILAGRDDGILIGKY